MRPGCVPHTQWVWGIAAAGQKAGCPSPGKSPQTRSETQSLRPPVLPLPERHPLSQDIQRMGCHAGLHSSIHTQDIPFGDEYHSQQSL